MVYCFSPIEGNSQIRLSLSVVLHLDHDNLLNLYVGILDIWLLSVHHRPHSLLLLDWQMFLMLVLHRITNHLLLVLIVYRLPILRHMLVESLWRDRSQVCIEHGVVQDRRIVQVRVALLVDERDGAGCLIRVLLLYGAQLFKLVTV